MAKMVILTAQDIQREYGFNKSYTYRLLNTKGCPVLPRVKNSTFRVIQDEFERWLRNGKVK